MVSALRALVVAAARPTTMPIAAVANILRGEDGFLCISCS
jgi:hypothetical protein